jgi:hypothetical protein
MTALTFSLVTVAISLVQIRNPDRKPVRAVPLAKLFGVGQHDKRALVMVEPRGHFRQIRSFPRRGPLEKEI